MRMAELTLVSVLPIRELAKTVVGGLAAIGIIAGATTPTASAESDHTYTIRGTNGEGVWLHGDPGLGDPGDLIKVIPEGARFIADCYVNDTPVGPKKNPVWLHGQDQGGVTGFITDYYSSSKWSRDNTLSQQGLPICNQASKKPPVTQLQNHEANPQNTGHYNRDRAVSWALANAEMQPPADGSCTWFASNVLWQGGLPKTKEWTSEGFYGNSIKTSILGSELSGTYAAWNVQAFRNYLRHTYPKSSWRELDFSTNVVPDAKLGSLIFYDWGQGEGISHVSVVTNIAEEGYPEVSEWSAGQDGSEPVSYSKRGWTWSEVSHKWLQEKLPYVKAYIMDIDTASMQTGSR